jgi:hypothetical protein
MLPVQKEFFNSNERFVALISSRSCGKSWIAIFSALTDLLMGRNVLYMAQTDGAFYKGAWLHLQNFLMEFNLLDRWSYNSTYKTGTLDLGNNVKSHFYYGSYENVSAARGATECSTLYLDEVCLSNPSILAVTAPCLRGKDNYGHVIVPRIRAVGTPDMSSLWQLMLVEHEKYGIKLLRSKMTDNVFMTDEQRELMSSAIFDEKLRRQEIDGEIILGESATSLITLKDFPMEAPYFSDDRVYGGLDMAHTGLRDGHCFAAIKGNKLIAFHEFGMASTLEVCEWIRRFNKAYKLNSISMDLAWSEAVYENLRYEIPCTQVAFAEKAPTEEAQREYANIRAFGYFKLAKMHKDGLCVDLESEWIDPGIVAEYKREITNIHFIMDKQGRLLIEPKDDIRVRLGRSPDPADALMLAALDRSEQDKPQIQVGKQERDQRQLRRYASMMGG